MSQQFSCPSCGSPVAFGSRFCGNCGTQLNLPTQQQIQYPPAYQQQMPPYYQQRLSYTRQQQYGMNWFQRHLNWTWVLSYLLMLVGAFVFGLLMFSADPNVSEDAVGGAAQIFGGIFMLVVSGWVIKQKGSALWWILLSGVFSPLWLENRKMKP